VFNALLVGAATIAPYGEPNADGTLTSALVSAIGTHSVLFTKLRDTTGTKCDTPCMASHIEENAPNGSIRNRGPIFLQTWKARLNVLTPIFQAISQLQNSCRVARSLPLSVSRKLTDGLSLTPF